MVPLVDFMPQPDTRVESMGAKTIPGVFLGYHIHPGGLWSGDYLVADLASFKTDCDAAKSKVKIHRAKEVVPNHSGKFIFPVALWRTRSDSYVNQTRGGLPIQKCLT